MARHLKNPSIKRMIKELEKDLNSCTLEKTNKIIVNFYKLKEISTKETTEKEIIEQEIGKNYLKLGDKFFKKNHIFSKQFYNKAIKYLKNLKRKTYIEVHNIGYSYFQISLLTTNSKEQFLLLDEAEKYFKKSKLLNENVLRNYERLASLYEHKARLEKDDEKCEMLLKKGEILLKNALVYIKKENTENKNIIFSKDTLGVIYKELGSLYLNKEKLEESEKCFIQAEKYYTEILDNLKKCDENNVKIPVYTNFGNIYYMFGNLETKKKKTKKTKLEEYYKKAEKYYKKAEKLDTENSDIYNNLGVIHLELKNNFQAELDLKKAIKLKKNNYIYYSNLGEIYQTYNTPEYLLKSIVCFEKAYDINKFSKKVLFFLGKALLKYLKTNQGAEKTLDYLLHNYEEKDNQQAIEKFIKYKCYTLINNLKEIEELNPKIRETLKDKIELNFLKEFKNKIKDLKKEKKLYNKKYYMYKPIEPKLINDLKEKRMWKSEPSFFNDPFDPYYKKFLTIITEKLKNVKISCFTESYNNLLMWAHYANNHKGICFGYKIKNIHTDDFTFFEKAIYKEIKTNTTIDNINNISIKIKEELLTISEIYLRKHKNWKYENEWRLINLNYDENYYYNIKVSEIYFGIDCSEKDKNSIIEVIKNNEKYRHDKIKFYQMIQGDNLSVKEKFLFEI